MLTDLSMIEEYYYLFSYNGIVFQKGGGDGEGGLNPTKQPLFTGPACMHWVVLTINMTIPLNL